MPPYERVLVARAEPVVGDGHGVDGVLRSSATLDDWFHGFEATLDVRDGEVVAASAGAPRTPWATCPGATAFVSTLRGPVADVAARLAASDRSHTCVHLNDTVWFASQLHTARRYDLTITRSSAELRRDGEVALGLSLDGWRVVGGPFDGLGAVDGRWRAAIDAAALDDDGREAVRVVRRGLLVAIGYYELDWESFRTAGDAGGPNMVNTCHTYTEPQLAVSTRTARLPIPRD